AGLAGGGQLVLVEGHPAPVFVEVRVQHRYGFEPDPVQAQVDIVSDRVAVRAVRGQQLQRLDAGSVQPLLGHPFEVELGGGEVGRIGELLWAELDREQAPDARIVPHSIRAFDVESVITAIPYTDDC